VADKIRFDWSCGFKRRQLGRSDQNQLLDIRAMSSYAGSVSGNSAPSRIWLPVLRIESEAFCTFAGKLPGKLLEMLLLLALSRVGVYLPLPGVNVDAFASSIDKVSPPPVLSPQEQGR
jgi:hypothetical protein